MLKAIVSFLFFTFVSVIPACAQVGSGAGAQDPYSLNEVLQCCTGLWQANHGYTDTSGKTYRFNAINTGVKNLVLILAGQSNLGGEAPTAYTVTNSTVVDNFSIYDGGMYTFSDPPLGSTWAYLALGGSLPTPNTGSVGGRIADLFINASIFARVIVVPVAVGGTSISQWDTAGPLYNRICVAMKRLASRGIAPGTNVTFAIVWGQGETDHGTATAAYKTALQDISSKANGCGFSGRFFVNEQTWTGTADTNVQSAQTTIVDSVTFWAGANADALTGSTCSASACRQADNTHFSDTGVASFASAIEAAMHASGAPF